jgi:type I restriction enzyme S subunit
MSTLAEAIGGSRRIVGGPFGSKLTQKDYQSDGVPVIRGSNMEQRGRMLGGKFVFVSTDKVVRDLCSNVVFPGDIIVTQRGTLGQVSIVPDDLNYEQFVVSQSQMAIRVDRAFADRDFVYYFLKSSGFNDYLSAATIQVGVPHINLAVLREAPVSWPSLDEQRSMASVLSVRILIV